MPDLNERYRPRRFADFIGQSSAIEDLRAMAQTLNMHSALAFLGPRGIGKTSAARALAAALNCDELGEDGEPCGNCSSCKLIFTQPVLHGKFQGTYDEIDCAAHGDVETADWLRDEIRHSFTGTWRVVFLDEAHEMSPKAFAMLLKVMEDAAALETTLIVATTRQDRIPSDVVSRCIVFNFEPIPKDDIVTRLRLISDQEAIAISDESLGVIAAKATGSMRDAIKVLGRATLRSDPNSIVDVFPKPDPAELVKALKALGKKAGHARLTKKQREVFGEVVERAIVRKSVDVGYPIQELAHAANVSRQTVYAALERLEESGFIERDDEVIRIKLGS